MRFSDYCVLACFTIIVLNMLATGIRFKKQGIDYQGRPPIQPLLYQAGKVASFGVWLLFVLAALRPQSMYALPGVLFPSNDLLCWIAAVLALAATVIIVVAFNHLGSALKFGLPTNETTTMTTTGMYRFSRNPQYLAFAMLDIGAVLYFPHIVVIVLAVITIWVHHLIVLAEERFLEQQFGQAYAHYKRSVQRYI